MGEYTYLHKNYQGVLLTLSVCILSVICLETPDKEPAITVNNYGTCSSSVNGDIETRLKQLEEKLDRLGSGNDSMDPIIRDCSEVPNMEDQSSGVFLLHPEDSPAFHAPCLFTEEGPWTIIQQRTDGKVDFQRCWQEYRRGFGSLNGSFYLGNDKIHAITYQRQYKLRVDIWDWGGMYLFADYKFFQIDNEEKKYTLHYANYSGNAGDALNRYHQNMNFSTLDQDNDLKPSEHCARLHGGGWWYNECDTANLNGYYSYEPELRGEVDQGVEWDAWMKHYSFKTVRMRITPAFTD